MISIVIKLNQLLRMAFLNTAPSMDFSVLILNLKSIISNFMLVV